MNTFATTAPITAVLNVPFGWIRVDASDRSDIAVEVTPADPGKGRDVKAAEQTTIDFEDGVLRVETPAANQYFGTSGAVQVTVHLPAGSQVEGKASSAGLETTGPLGEVSFDGAYREIKFEQVESLRLTATDGNVEVGRLNGPAEISTARGDIKIAEAGAGKVALRTKSGDISIAAAPGVSASLDAHTGHGRIGNALKNDGAVELEIEAATPHGDINARSL